jgi:glutamine amidotransferase
MDNKITLLDYGMGNLRSVAKALEQTGGRVCLTSTPSVVAKASKCVVPGVGAFGDAMKELKKRKLLEPLKEYLASGKPFLGICLGLQLLFEESEEGNCKGLGVLEGKVIRFNEPRATSHGSRLKVPHMGWNQIRKQGTGDRGQKKRCPLLKGLPDNSYFYFVHSYYVKPADKEIIAATTEYGTEFTSIIWSGSIFATQFHPEKSQETGLRLLRNFVNYANPSSD